MAQVRQITNVLELLEYFRETGQPATMTQLSDHFGWPRSSTFNIIDTLTSAGFLYEPRKRGGFYPTPRWLSLAQDISAAEPLPEALIDLVAQLAAQSGETVWVATPSGQYAIFLHIVMSRHPIRYMAEAGQRMPIHATATGEALLSQMSAAQIATILRRATYTQFSTGSPLSADEVMRRITAGRERGWFESSSNYSHDLGGISVPLRLNDRNLSITVAGPLFRVVDRKAEIAGMIHDGVATLLA